MHQDNARSAWPLRVEAARQWREGTIPLWNPYKRAGAPLLADVVAGAAYPGNAPFLIVHDGYAALEDVACLHYLLAAVLMYGFLRTISIAPVAAGLGAFIFSSNGLLMWLTGSYIQMQNATAWLPLVLIGVDRASRPGGIAWVAIGAIAVTLQLLAGYPEYSFYTALIAGGYALALTSRARRWRPVVVVFLIYALGAGLGAFQLLPTRELTALSRRSSVVSLNEYLTVPASPAMWLGWLTADASVSLFPPPVAYHWGAVAVVLAIVGAVGRARVRIFFALVLVVGVVLAIGDHTPFGVWAHALPGLRAFRHPFKHLFEVMTAFAVLAAFGADALLRRERGMRSVVALASAAAAAVIMVHRGPLMILALGSTVGFALLVAARRAELALGLALIVLWVSYADNQRIVSEGQVPAQDVATAAKTIARYIEPGARIFAPDFLSIPNEPERLIADFPTLLRIPAVHGSGPFTWAPLARALNQQEEAIGSAVALGPSQALDVLAGRYVLLPHLHGPVDVPFANVVNRPPYRKIVDTGDSLLVERTTALPLVRFVPKVTCASTETSMRALSTRRGDDLRDIALIDCAGGTFASDVAGQGAIAIRSHEAASWTIATDIPGNLPGFIVVSQSNLPGWRACVDGVPVTIHTTDALVQGIEVPPGEHIVTLRYVPATFWRGCIVSALAAVALSGMFALHRRSNLRTPSINNASAAL